MTKTAKTYGGALYDLARDENLTGEIMNDLSLVTQLFRDTPDYRKLLCEPSIPKDERKSLLDEAWQGRIHPYTLNFLKLLLDNGTVGQLADCTGEYRLRYNEDHDILPVRAVSAVALSDAQTARLCAVLQKKTGKQIDLTVSVDETVLGGMRLSYAGNQYDGTVRHHLEEIGKLLQNTVL